MGITQIFNKQYSCELHKYCLARENYGSVVFKVLVVFKKRNTVSKLFAEYHLDQIFSQSIFFKMTTNTMSTKACRLKTKTCLSVEFNGKRTTGNLQGSTNVKRENDTLDCDSKS